MDIRKNGLDSAEITNLWTHYLRETMAICVHKHVLKTIKDHEIRSVFEMGLKQSNTHLQKLRDFFRKENFPEPNGFTNEDVHLNAPPLFTDFFWLEYIHRMATHGSTAYNLALSASTQKEIRDFYYQCMNDSMDIYNMSQDVLISKGLYERPPGYSPPKEVSYVTEYNYVTDVFGKKRPLNSMESGIIYFNVKKAITSKVILIGFSQVCQKDDVRKFMEKGINVANNHIELFSSILHQDNLRSPRLLDSEVTNSTIAPFSDKLMLYHAGFLFSAGVSYYGTALVASMRADIVAHCETSILRALKGMAKFGQLMIKNKWLEQPPQADDRKQLK